MVQSIYRTGRSIGEGKQVGQYRYVYDFVAAFFSSSNS